MTDSAFLEKLRPSLLNRAELMLSGLSDKRIQASVRRGELRRLSPGLYVRREQWETSGAVDRHLLSALAVHESAAAAPTFSHLTAAAILGLPLLMEGLGRVHTLQQRTSKVRSSPRVLRHTGAFAERETQVTAGLTHTDLTRTTIDIARTGAFEQGVIAGDAAIRRLVERDGGTLEHHRASLLRTLERMPRSAGYRRATRVLQFLDDGAGSPLESLFRLQFARLGFQVRTQVPVQNPDGGFYRLDFELIGHDAFFEADGKVKYTDADMLRGRSAGQVFFEEKTREDWVRGRERKSVLRGGWEHARTMEATAARLRAFGVIPPAGRAPLHLF